MQLSTESKLKKAPSILPEINRNQYDKEHSSINRNLTNTEYIEVNSSHCEKQDSMETVDKNRESWFYTERKGCVSLWEAITKVLICAIPVQSIIF